MGQQGPGSGKGEERERCAQLSGEGRNETWKRFSDPHDAVEDAEPVGAPGCGTGVIVPDAVHYEVILVEARVETYRDPPCAILASLERPCGLTPVSEAFRYEDLMRRRCMEFKCNLLLGLFMGHFRKIPSRSIREPGEVFHAVGPLL